MKADPFAQLKLLDVQELDAKLDLLRRQLANLTEHTELKALAASRSEIDSAARDLTIKVDDLTREQKKADADVEQVKGRRKRDQDRLDQGLVTNPKDLEHLQHELVSLDRRVNELEDVELEVMEQLEDAQNELSDLTAQLQAVNDKGGRLLRSREDRTAGINSELGAVAAERKQTAAGVPSELLVLYDRLRDQKGGVGAAALRVRRCDGCSLELNPADLAAIKAKPADEVVRCEECSRILVRTSESAL